MDDSNEGGFPGDTVISDEELTALALAADPSQPLDPAATPWRFSLDSLSPLPEWYMPSPSAVGRGPVVKVVVGVIVGAFVLVNALGLCVTYGFITVA